MPRHRANTTVFPMRVTRNSRPDGDYRYNVTLPKRLGDEVWNGGAIKGTFDLDVMDWHHEKGESYPEVMLWVVRATNLWIGTQRTLQDAKWEKLFCLECGRDVVLIFPPDASKVSYLSYCECGASFFSDKRDQTMIQLGEKSQYDNWRILHNYDVRTGMHASDLHPDFDIETGELFHVFFSKAGSLPADFPLRVLDDAERERLLQERVPTNL